MKKFYLTLFFTYFLTVFSFSQNINFEKDSIALLEMQPVSITQLEIPYCNQEDVISHTGFSLLYSNQHKQAHWVAYQLTKEKTTKAVERGSSFRPDPKVSTGTANNNDYKGSGYDRGHLAPAADMAWSSKSMKSSFYYSNISPQVPDFNRGIWKKLEALIRTWATDNDTIYVITGPILEEQLPTIGKNKVSVPAAYYKVILDYTLPTIKAIAFIIPNEKSNLPLTHYVVSVDEVEKITEIDFFHRLPDEQEAIIERTVCKSLWSW
ncbi:MAG TPA: DNA/RNA non-specific endonuclease [Bacteroidales bacterium]|nr:DNA/RNA non-specific endonuclease [Bacteroidales bacterium]